MIGGAVLLLSALWNLSEAREMIGMHQQAVAAEKLAPAARSEEQKAAIEEWKESSAKPTASELAEEHRRDRQCSPSRSRSSLDRHQSVDRALQYVGGGMGVDAGGALGAADVGLDHHPLDRDRRPAFVP